MEPVSPVVAGVKKLLTQDDFLRPESVHKVQDLLAKVGEYELSIVVVSAPTQDELGIISSDLYLLRTFIQAKKVKVIAVVGMSDPEIRAMLVDAGCTEVVVEPIVEKALNLKIGRLARFTPEPEVHEILDRASEERNQDLLKVKMVPPIRTSSDCWLYQEGSVRKVLGRRWVLRFTGPARGRWLQDEPGVWRWFPHEAEQSAFLPESGSWVFYGDKPELQQGEWVFAGETISLIFESESGKNPEPPRRFWLNEEGILHIPVNSSQAICKTDTIRQSLAAYNAMNDQAGPDPMFREPPPGPQTFSLADSQEEESREITQPPAHRKRRKHARSRRLKPVAAALVLAEWLANEKKTPEHIPGWFCHFLEGVVLAKGVALWMKNDDGWVQVAGRIKEATRLSNRISKTPTQIERLDKEHIILGPIRSGDRTIGVLAAELKSDSSFTDEEFQALLELSSGMIYAIDLKVPSKQSQAA